jgi:hypothetical protein
MTSTSIVSARAQELSKSSVVAKLLKFIPVLALLVALAGIWIAVQSRKKEISCEFTGASRLVSVVPGGIPGDVRMDFHGEPVKSLTRMTFTIRNTGAAAVKKEDVRETLRLVFPSSVSVLSASTESTTPTGIQFVTTLSPDSHQVLLSFDLLNASDEARIAVYLINSDPAAPLLLGRIVDVPKLVMSYQFSDDKAYEPPIQSHALRKAVRWVLIFALGIGFGFFFFFASFTAYRYIGFLRWTKKWKAQVDSVERKARDLPADADSGLLKLDYANMNTWPQTVKSRVLAAGVPMAPDPLTESLKVNLAVVFSNVVAMAVCAGSAFMVWIALR